MAYERQPIYGTYTFRKQPGVYYVKENAHQKGKKLFSHMGDYWACSESAFSQPSEVRATVSMLQETNRQFSATSIAGEAGKTNYRGLN